MNGGATYLDLHLGKLLADAIPRTGGKKQPRVGVTLLRPVGIEPVRVVLLGIGPNERVVVDPIYARNHGSPFVNSDTFNHRRLSEVAGNPAGGRVDPGGLFEAHVVKLKLRQITILHLSPVCKNLSRFFHALVLVLLVLCD